MTIQSATINAMHPSANSTVRIWAFIFVGGLVFARAALVYGHRFWFGLLQAIRGLMN